MTRAASWQTPKIWNDRLLTFSKSRRLFAVAMKAKTPRGAGFGVTKGVGSYRATYRQQVSQRPRFQPRDRARAAPPVARRPPFCSGARTDTNDRCYPLLRIGTDIQTAYIYTSSRLRTRKAKCQGILSRQSSNSRSYWPCKFLVVTKSTI